MTLERLTATEARVAGLLASGYADSDIRAELEMSPQELESHLTRVFRKLGVRSRTELTFLLGTGALSSAASRSNAKSRELPDDPAAQPRLASSSNSSTRNRCTR
jgi:DNA-binding CsgD family transcriptional regulator